MGELSILAQNQTLTLAGWVLMVGCVGMVCGLCIFCFVRIMRSS